MSVRGRPESPRPEPRAGDARVQGIHAGGLKRFLCRFRVSVKLQLTFGLVKQVACSLCARRRDFSTRGGFGFKSGEKEKLRSGVR